MKIVVITMMAIVMLVTTIPAAEFHVAPNGNNSNPGTQAAPLLTIQRAANLAQAGDVIIVHAGTYRERVIPPRGGESDARRIVYQAAPGEQVVIKGSEVVHDWKPFMPGVWKATMPNKLFGASNPYKELITGDWFTDKGRPHHTGEVYFNGKSLWETHLLERVLNPQPVPDAWDREGSTWTWYCESDDTNTYIYANFHERNPNQELVEINVRDSCFYPDQPGRNYITVRGFRMSQAATQWAAPTAEQIGLIGTHWSQGWIIEDNVISDSKCSGITLGKDRMTGHNVWSKDPCKDGAIHYIEVIMRALAAGWSREVIGSHIVRNNTIFNCEQTGICGSLGAVFSQITNNHIYNIWAKRQFTGAEMAGIKIHASIDMLIKNNRIHNAGRGMWMDWMAQGTRITGNLCYDNSTDDLFVEVDHGPFLVDNNLFLSPVSLSDMSEGGAYVHNLITGKITSWPEPNRSTPYHQPHSTALAGLSPIKGGDDRFYNNILVGDGIPPAVTSQLEVPNSKRAVGFGLWVYDGRELPLQTGGNVYYHGACAFSKETSPQSKPEFNAEVKVVEEGERVFLHLNLNPELSKAATLLVTTGLLGKAAIPGLPYENADGSALKINTDYLGKQRNETAPSAGPFEAPGAGLLRLKVW
jgi:hypothetical protein